MYQITSIDQLRIFPAEIRALRKGFVTNFYFDVVKHSVWIAKGDCFVERVRDSLFIVRKSLSFWNIFYCSTTLEELTLDLADFISLHIDVTMIVDIVGRESQCVPVTCMFKEAGFKEAISLVRMSRKTQPMMYVPCLNVRRADVGEMAQIHHFLHKFFDEKTEQIPYLDELEEYARKGHVLVYWEQCKIKGFLIYELNNTTLYLRYWLTHPEYRDQKVGSHLLRRFFEEGKGTRRQLFWVKENNKNAIVRYHHYGFEEENMYDYVMRYN